MLIEDALVCAERLRVDDSTLPAIPVSQSYIVALADEVLRLRSELADAELQLSSAENELQYG